MNPAKSLMPSASSFSVTKHSWKGKYRRVLSVGPESFSTYNPSSMDETNAWKTSDIVNIQPQGDSEFQLTFRKGAGKKTDSMKFSSEWRAIVLTEGLRWLQLGGNDTAAAATKVIYTCLNFSPNGKFDNVLHLSCLSTSIKFLS